jgi:hypothetical protein
MYIIWQFHSGSEAEFEMEYLKRLSAQSDMGLKGLCRQFRIV